MFIHVSRTDMPEMPTLLRDIASKLLPILAIGSFLSILGPYGTHGLGMPGAWLYWTGLIALGWASGWLAGAAFERWQPAWPMPLIYLVVSVLVSVPVTLAVLVLQSVTGAAVPLDQIPVVFVLVWVISAAVTAINWLRDERTRQSTSPAQPLPVSRTLTDKLPHRLRRADILALESEDHYLRVHTRAGDALILMRLSDAIEAVAPLDGTRTHRSWWVARDAVERVERGNGRAILHLVGDIAAPVSRTYAPKLREDGWY